MACKTELIWIFSIITLCILIITSVYINDKRRVRLTLKLTETDGEIIRVAPRTRMGLGVATHVPIAPLWWDKEEGAYMLKLKLGESRVELVLDTGSSQISAKGTGCQWTSCEDGDSKSCSTQQCPCGTSMSKDGAVQARKDCNSFYYVPKGRFISPGEEGAGTKTKLIYGSQEDTVSHYMDAVSLPCMSDNTIQKRFLLENIPASNEDDTLNNNEYLLGDMIVHFVHHIQGSSSSNLIGLARPMLKTLGPEYGKHVTIEKMLAGSDNVWSLLLEPQGGWFILGSLAPSFPLIEYVPMVDPPMFRDFVTHFYVLDILSLEVGPDLNHMKLIKKRKPKYCILDTGTTYTYGCAALGKELVATGYDELSWYVRLRLGNKKNNTVLTYSAAELQDVDFPSFSVFQCDAARTLPDFNAIFPDPDVLLFGALMMQHHYWEFDMERKRIGVCRVK